MDLADNVHSPDHRGALLWRQDAQGVLLWANEACLHCLGKSGEQVAGRRLDELWPVELAQRLVSEATLTLRDGQIRTLELEMPANCCWEVHLLRGAPNALIAIARDIGHHHQINAHKLANIQQPAVSPPTPVTFDLDDLRAQTGAEGDFLRQLLETFLHDADERIAQLALAITTNDGEHIRRLIHTLKGASGSLGMREIQQLCIELDALAPKDLLAQAPEYLTTLCAALKRAHASAAPYL